MKRLIRLKTTTPENKVFLSPFVFPKKEAQRRLMKSILREREDTITELLKVTNYPPKAIWTESRYGKTVISIRGLIKKISVIEERWEVIDSVNIGKDA